jgi:hypothetical protein
MNGRKFTAALVCCGLACLGSSNVARAAGGYVNISDVSALQYQMASDGVVWLRNLNAFNSSVTGCCYAFYLDTTSPYGKSAWALVLMKMATGGGLWMYVSEMNPPTSGNPAAVQQLGNW